MNKLNYITRQLARASRKRFEHYVITRIWHLLDDLDLKIITQQYVVREKGYALTDLFFPQLGIHIEVDENYHLNQKEKDQFRKADIVNATKHRILNIDTSKGIENTNQQIQEAILIIKKSKENASNFKPWNLNEEQDPQTYIKRGYIRVEDDVAFPKSYLAANCFGHKYSGFQKGGTKHPKEDKKLIWFPRLYPNGDWKNSISDDEEKITELSLDSQKTRRHIDEELKSKINKRIVFARVKSPLGDVMYRFRGEYQLDEEESNYDKGLIWKRIATKVKTYPN